MEHNIIIIYAWNIYNTDFKKRAEPFVVGFGDYAGAGADAVRSRVLLQQSRHGYARFCHH